MNKLFNLLFPMLVSAHPVIQEVMADPDLMADSDAEYVEIFDSEPILSGDTLILSIGTHFYEIPSNAFTGNHYLVLGPDSLRQQLPTSASLLTPASWSLTNSTELTAVLRSKSGVRFDSTVIPRAKSGIAWQRSASTWVAALTQAPWGDLGNPGWSGDSSALASVSVQKLKCEEGSIELILDRGNVDQEWNLQYGLDADLDGSVDDSSQITWSGGVLPLNLSSVSTSARLVLRMGLGSPLPGQQIILPLRCAQSAPTLAFSELFVAPLSEQSEWFEIRNRGSVAVDLCKFQWASASSKASLCSDRLLIDPGSFVVFAEDTIAFRNRYGAVRIDLVRPSSWPSLNNSGGSLKILDIDGYGLDSVAWGPATSDRSLCEDSLGAWTMCIWSSPGFGLVPKAGVAGLQIANPTLRRSDDFMMWSRLGVDGNWSLYDLDGQLVDQWQCASMALCRRSSTEWPMGRLLLRGRSVLHSNPNIRIQVLP